MATNVVGALLQLIAADQAMSLAFPGLPVYRGEIPQEFTLPWVEVEDRQDPERWITSTVRRETHHVTFSVYAPVAAAGQPTTSDVIAGHLIRIMNWQADSIALPGTFVINVRQTGDQLTLEQKRAPDKSRVTKTVVAFDADLEVSS